MRGLLCYSAPSGNPFPNMTPPFTACSKAMTYDTSMTMFYRLLLICLVGLPAYGAVSVPHAAALGPRDEQDAARRAMLEGRVMPFALIKRRMENEMGDATYLGSEFHENSNRYRLKYVREGRVVWVDVDGRTGQVTGWAH